MSAGLVLEGGGMRGVYTAGVLEFFMDNNLYFPYVIGMSAGACVAASYISQQKGRNKIVNIEYCNHPNYISFKNIIKHRQVFGMDFIFDEIPKKLVPFDFSAFRKSPQRFVVGATDCITGNPVYYEKKDIGDDITTILRASSSLPYMAPMISYGDRVLLDGGIADPLPIKKAEQDGYTKNVVILTRNGGYRKEKTKLSWLYKQSFKDYPGLLHSLVNRHHLYNDVMDYIEEQEARGNVIIIRPQKPLEVSRVERNPQKLLKLYEDGYQDAKDTFQKISAWLPEEIVQNR
ncbi:patatin family protein [Bacillus sp. HMF5848]|uniref:patatin-like phospholipase family protein n=1 Tax=Bacillus sp. HMF5848 TaxID=2495421 RepID=UPI000F78D6DA|nr:patatin family protein [Bacillus sp. HMF5848]RSK26741.1 patatin family protein [Bacillus sp. HMF5848]